MKKETDFLPQQKEAQRVTRTAAGVSRHTYRVKGAAPSPAAVNAAARLSHPVRQKSSRLLLRRAVCIGVPLLLFCLLGAVALGVLFGGGTSGNVAGSSVPLSIPAGTESTDDAVSRGMLSTREEAEAWLRAHPDQNTESLLRLLNSNTAPFSFVAGYPEKYRTQGNCTLTAEDLKPEENRLLPLLMQWDERWGYTDYGGYLFGTNACGPTVLSMVAAGLTGDASLHPRAVADFAEQNGYAAAGGNGSEWALMSRGGEQLGLVVKEIYAIESMVRAAVENGHPVVCIMGPGVFTTSGHFIVIVGEEDGRFLINDSNSVERSAKSWAFEDFCDQIQCLWEFSYDEPTG